jgi:hypothetical protein
MANKKQPAEFCRDNFSSEKGQDYDQEIKFMKGTTTLAFKVRDVTVLLSTPTNSAIVSL